MENKHTSYDLVQMQSLPLEAKIEMTKRRIEEWYKAWKKYTIVDRKTGKTRYVTWTEEPNETGCFRKKVKTVDGQKTEVDVMVSGTKLKPTEYVDSCEDGQVYVSFSGGKDSTVLKHIVDSMYPDVPALFINTGLEYPEIQKFARAQKGVVEVRPEMRFDEVVKKYGYPIVSKEVAQSVSRGRKDIPRKKYSHALCKLGVKIEDYGGLVDGGKVNYESILSKPTFMCGKYKFLLDAHFNASHMCCDVMKKAPAKKYQKQSMRKPMVGMLAAESRLRRAAWKKHGCNAFTSDSPISQPLAFWTEQDVLKYIKEKNISICSVYGDVVEEDNSGSLRLKTTRLSRTGCIFCGFGCHLEKCPNRFQLLKETHPRQYDYCINGGEYNEEGQWQPSKDGLGLGKVLDYIGVPYK